MSENWIECAKACPYFCEAHDQKALMVLSIGDAAPGSYPGEPTYGETSPSYQARRQAITGKVVESEDRVRVWKREDELMRTAAFDETVGYFICRHHEFLYAQDVVSLSPSEVVSVIHATSNHQDVEKWCMDVLNIQQWYLKNCRFRVYDFKLYFFPSCVKFHTNGWAYERANLPNHFDPIVRGLDNIVLHFSISSRNESIK